MGFLFSLLGTALNLASIVLLIYCVMSFVAPQNELFYKLASFVDPILNPVRQKAHELFPSLNKLPVDISPMVLYILIELAGALLSGIGRVI